MSGQQMLYRLSIEAILPNKIVEDEIFTVTYRVRNIDTSVFPGGTVLVMASLPSNAGFVSHPVHINSLQPNDSTEQVYPDMRAISGLTTFFSGADTFIANNGGTIELYLVDRRRLHMSQLFAVIRARTHEEVSQARAVWIAAYSLVGLIIVQIFDWLIRYYWRF